VGLGRAASTAGFVLFTELVAVNFEEDAESDVVRQPGVAAGPAISCAVLDCRGLGSANQWGLAEAGAIDHAGKSSDEDEPAHVLRTDAVPYGRPGGSGTAEPVAAPVLGPCPVCP